MWRRTQRVNYRWQWNQYRVRLLFHFHFLLIWLPHVSIKVHRNIRWPILAMKKSQRARIHPPIHIDTHTHTHTHILSERPIVHSIFYLYWMGTAYIHSQCPNTLHFPFFFQIFLSHFFIYIPHFPFLCLESTCQNSLPRRNSMIPWSLTFTAAILSTSSSSSSSNFAILAILLMVYFV